MTKPQTPSKLDKQALTDNPLTSPKAKGERLKRLRHLANLSREAFCANGDINLTTLISWEVGRFGGLSAKGAKRVIARVEQEGVFCTPEWLLYEVGAGPQVISDYKKMNVIKHNSQSYSVQDQDEIIIQELMFFRKLNNDAIDFIIMDDTMQPYYKQGEYVAGPRYYEARINELVGHNCIVQTLDGRILVRLLQQGPSKSSYNLLGLNTNSNSSDLIIYNVTLVCAAPVLWHRKKDPIVLNK